MENNLEDNYIRIKGSIIYCVPKASPKQGSFSVGTSKFLERISYAKSFDLTQERICSSYNSKQAISVKKTLGSENLKWLPQ